MMMNNSNFKVEISCCCNITVNKFSTSVVDLTDDEYETEECMQQIMCASPLAQSHSSNGTIPALLSRYMMFIGHTHLSFMMFSFFKQGVCWPQCTWFLQLPWCGCWYACLCVCVCVCVCVCPPGYERQFT